MTNNELTPDVERSPAPDLRSTLEVDVEHVFNAETRCASDTDILRLLRDELERVALNDAKQLTREETDDADAQGTRTLVLPADAFERINAVTAAPAVELDRARTAPLGPGNTQVLWMAEPAIAPQEEATSTGPDTRIAPIEHWLEASHTPVALPEPAKTVVLEPSRLVTNWRERWCQAPGRRRAAWLLSPLAVLGAIALLLPGGAETNDPAGTATQDAHAVGTISARAPSVAAARPSTSETRVTLPVLPPGKTLARAAADAVAEGNDALALATYQKLLQDHPEVPAYAAALRVLEGRAHTGKAR